MASSRLDITLLTSLALDGELSADDAARLAAARTESAAAAASADKVESIDAASPHWLAWRR